MLDWVYIYEQIQDYAINDVKIISSKDEIQF